MIKPFRFKEFTIHQDKTAMKVGTDAVLLGAWCRVRTIVDTVLDVGSGTGVIALMLAQRCNAMTIDAVEIDESAYEQSVENFEQSDWGDRLYCYHSSFQEFAQEIAEEEEDYELIISNPPFYNDSYETDNDARNKARFTSSLSFENLLENVVLILNKEGVFATVIPHKEQEKFIELAKEKGLFVNRICNVKGNENTDFVRCLLEFSFIETKIEEEILIIEKERHQYTEKYKELTKDFYLKM